MKRDLDAWNRAVRVGDLDEMEELIEQGIDVNEQSALAELDMEALMRKVMEQGKSANDAEMRQRMLQVPELAALMGGVSSSMKDAATIARQLIKVGLAKPQSQNHVRLHPALGPYLASELTGDVRQAAQSAWMESMRQLTEFLYHDRVKAPKVAYELTLLQLPNLVAALESLSAAVGVQALACESTAEVQDSASQSKKQAEACTRAPVSVLNQWGASPLQGLVLNPVSEGNCVLAKGGGEQLDENDQSVG